MEKKGPINNKNKTNHSKIIGNTQDLNEDPTDF